MKYLTHLRSFFFKIELHAGEFEVILSEKVLVSSQFS